MKHLSDTPRPPSLERPEIPPDLDMVVLRALAKNPDDRFQTAEEMDAELARVAAGRRRHRETADAATAVLSGHRARECADGDRAAAPRRPPVHRPSYRYADPPRAPAPDLALAARAPARRARGRRGLVTPTDGSRTRSSGSGRSRCRTSSGSAEDLAVAQRAGEGARRRGVHREPNETQKEGLVFRPGPRRRRAARQGEHGRRSTSRTGPPKVKVPDVTGDSRDEAISTLTDARPGGQGRGRLLEGGAGHGRRPGPGRRADGEQGLERPHQRLAGPPADRDPDRRRPALRQRRRRSSRAAGSPWRRQDVDSSQPKDTVIGQSPSRRRPRPRAARRSR